MGYCLTYLNNLQNGSFRNRENLRYKKTADLVLLSLFMTTNGKCKNYHAPPLATTFKAVFCLPSEPNIPERPEYEKISKLYQCTGRNFTNSMHAAQRQLLRPLNNLEYRILRSRENLRYKKTADLALLSLFMRINGKCNNSHAPKA